MNNMTKELEPFATHYNNFIANIMMPIRKNFFRNRDSSRGEFYNTIYKERKKERN